MFNSLRRYNLEYEEQKLLLILHLVKDIERIIKTSVRAKSKRETLLYRCKLIKRLVVEDRVELEDMAKQLDLDLNNLLTNVKREVDNLLSELT